MVIANPGWLRYEQLQQESIVAIQQYFSQYRLVIQGLAHYDIKQLWRVGDLDLQIYVAMYQTNILYGSVRVVTYAYIMNNTVIATI